MNLSTQESTYSKHHSFCSKFQTHLGDNTTNLILPGVAAETQVIALDLAGVAVSAGAACSSGKVRASRVLRAMGFDDGLAAQAIRVSLGPQTTEEEVLRFAEVWGREYARIRSREI